MNPVALRVDVDFEIGLVRGVPHLLDLFEERGIKATFYVTMGPDGFSKNKSRVKTKGYLKRILNFRPWRIVRRFGVPYLAKQFLGPGGSVGSSHPDLLRAIVERGHEIGVHGFDHFWWAENVFTDSGEGVASDLRRGYEVLESAVGPRLTSDAVWASPNWRCSQKSLEFTEKLAPAYGADTRGSGPFLPKIGDWQSGVMQLPITLPCLHEIKNYLPTPSQADIVREFLRHVRGPFDVWCVHDYYEGVLERELFAATLDALIETGRQIIPMREMATLVKASGQPIPVRELGRGHLPGGRGEVSVHEGFGR